MHQAQVHTWGEPPRYVEVPSPPSPGPGEVKVKLLATGLHRVVRSRAAGSHYSSSSSSAGLPHVPGIDGTGTTEDGKIVYFSSFTGPGAMSEEVNLPARSLVELPEGLDPIKAAALVNSAMSSWMALAARTSGLKQGFGVLILGVTSASGRLAVPLSRALGAGSVVGAARNGEAMKRLGLDTSIVLSDKVEDTDWSVLGQEGVDIVLDYVGGPLTTHLLSTIHVPAGRALQYVHIGSLSGSTSISIPGAALRGEDITIRGSGPGAWSLEGLGREMPGLLEALKGVDDGMVGVRSVSLRDVEAEWVREESGQGERVVFVP